MEYCLKFIRETDQAICVTETEDWESNEIGLPKSKIETTGKHKKGAIINVEIPGWLAEAKELA